MSYYMSHRQWPHICEVARAIDEVDYHEGFYDKNLEGTYDGIPKLKSVLLFSCVTMLK